MTDSRDKAAANKLDREWRVGFNEIDVMADYDYIAPGVGKRAAARIVTDHNTMLRALNARTASVEGLYEALKPFAEFGAQWKRQPLKGVADDFYGIHAGTEYEAVLRISACIKAVAAIAAYEGKGTK